MGQTAPIDPRAVRRVVLHILKAPVLKIPEIHLPQCRDDRLLRIRKEDARRLLRPHERRHKNAPDAAPRTVRLRALRALRRQRLIGAADVAPQRVSGRLAVPDQIDLHGSSPFITVGMPQTIRTTHSARCASRTQSRPTASRPRRVS